jgi:hypothetical protein
MGLPYHWRLDEESKILNIIPYVAALTRFASGIMENENQKKRGTRIEQHKK